MDTQWIYYSILILVTLGGGIIGARLSKASSNILIPTFLPFSGAFLLGILVLHMAPIVYGGEKHNIVLGGFIIVGFLIQLFLERFTQGLEHGHLHVQHHQPAKFAMYVMIGLCVHSLIEGLPLLHSDHAHHNHTDENYLYALVLHKFPAAMTLGILFQLSKLGQLRFYIYLVLFSIMTPLGGIIGNEFLTNPTAIKAATALVLGSFLHISTTIIFESDKTNDHRISYKKLIAILSGLAFAFLSVSIS